MAQGDHVTLVLEAEDVTHGLYLDGYDVDLVAVPRRTDRATFVADRPRKFRLRCSKVCGTLHPFMLGELIVPPQFALLAGHRHNGIGGGRNRGVSPGRLA